MRITLSSSPFTSLQAGDTLALLCTPETVAGDAAFLELDRARGGALSTAMAEEGFKAAWKKTSLHRPGAPGPGRLVFIGIDEPPLPLRLALKQAAGLAVGRAQDLKATRLTIALLGSLPGDLSRATTTRLLVEGALLAAHQRLSYKHRENDSPTLVELVICWPGQDTLALRDAAARGELVANAANTTRDLVNEPAGTLTPEVFAGKVANLAGSSLSVETRDLRWLQDKGMGGIIGVGRGSANEPRLVEVGYRLGEGGNDTLLLVGKGVTFDSGGISLKPADSMKTMKDDMAGAGALAGLVSVLDQLRPERPVRVLLPLVENMPDGRAIKVGDVLHMYGGKSVEVLNTDAEGRLILADALAYGEEAAPAAIIDMATLTGASVVALGLLCAAVMGNRPELVRDVLSAGERAGEIMWQLPLIDAYKKMLESKIADLKNVGDRWGGAITAGIFLREFVGGKPWVHIDLAGPSWSEKDEPAFPEGGSGFGVASIIELLSPMAG
ncbi:MAG: leucyl aminopeptidase [Candidatus Eisenbacteria bacterium]|jgi:leucyl aminopeptidase|nr:leucyl aminopeptidase [Candidatus Eisenbacteria bacterium]